MHGVDLGVSLWGVVDVRLGYHKQPKTRRWSYVGTLLNKAWKSVILGRVGKIL